VIDHIPNYHTKIILRDINAKWGEREYFQADNRELESTSG